MAEWAMESMAATLTGEPRLFFSETARSRVGHGEAVRHREPHGPRPVLLGRLADDRAERAAERPEAHEADVEADLGHAAVRLAQQEHRPLDAPALQVAVQRLAERRPERGDEVRLGDVGDPREGGDVERLRIRAFLRVPRAEQVAVGILDGAAHVSTLTSTPGCSGTCSWPSTAPRPPSGRSSTPSTSRARSTRS